MIANDEARAVVLNLPRRREARCSGWSGSPKFGRHHYRADIMQRLPEGAETAANVWPSKRPAPLCSASGGRLLAYLIVAPRQGYDEPEFLSYTIRPFCPTGADGLQD